MDHRTLMTEAAAPVHDLLGRVGVADLASATPCSEFDVRGLLLHLLTWGPALEAAARKQPATPGEPDDVDLVPAVDAQLRRTVAAWSDAGAWEGTTSVGSPEPMPAALIGGMVLTEVVVHGWDLGRALGERPSWDAAVEERVLAEVTATAGTGREMGIYADAVPVPPDAPVLHRLLGLTGRDPA